MNYLNIKKLSLRITAQLCVAILIFVQAFGFVESLLPAVFIKTEVAQAAGEHDYFNKIISLPQHYRSWSLRDQAQLNAFVASRVEYTSSQRAAGAPVYYDPIKISHSWQYVYPGDTFGNKDAARLYMDSSNTATSPYYNPAIPLLEKLPWHVGPTLPRSQVLNFPLGVSNGSILVSVDTWYSRGWRYNRTEFDRQFKPFRFRMSGDDTFWSAHQVGGWPQTANEAGGKPAYNTSFGQIMNLLTTDDYPGSYPTGMTGKDPVSPTGQSAIPTRGINMPYETWVRHIFEIKLLQPPSAFTSWNAATGKTLAPNPKDPEGLWTMVSSWVLTESGGPWRTLYQVPYYNQGRAPIVDFNFNHHTSQDWPTMTGPLVLYARNVTALRNYALPAVPETDTTIFARPLPSAGGAATPPPPPVTTVNQLPQGNFDEISSTGVVKGWSFDPDAKASTNTVHMYVDTAAGAGKTPFATFNTSLLRSDINTSKGVTGNHGFEYTIPSSLKDGKPHTLYAYAIDINDSTKSVLLTGSPKTFNFVAPVNPPPPPVVNPPPPVSPNPPPPSTGGGGGGSVRPTPPPSVKPTPTPVPTAGRHSRGSLVNYNGTIYFVGADIKYPFPSAAVFLSWGSRFQDVVPANSGDIAMPTGPVVEFKITAGVTRHPRATLVNQNGTIYFLGADIRYPFPSAAVFLSWGSRFQDVVPANSGDIAMPIGPIVELKK